MPWEEEGGGAVWGEVVGTLTDQTDLDDELAAKQATLVSATNIKTINGGSVLGSGNLVVAGAAAWGSVTGTLGDQTDLQTALDAKQPLDADLTTIAGLAATTNNFMVSAASAWASRTPAQAKTALALAKADVGLSNVDDTSDAGKPVSTATQTALDLKATLASPTFTGTVAGVTKAMVGLTNANDTTDAGKPVSTAQQTALDLKANLAGPTFTGVPAAPTAAADTNTTQLATTAMVVAQAGASNPVMNGAVAVGTSLRYSRQDHIHASDTSRAALAGPTFTGVPAAPTAAAGTNTTQLATTAFVLATPLDTLAATTDIATLNSSTTAHGLLKKLDNVSTNFLNGQGNWAAPTAVIGDGDKGAITITGGVWAIDAGVVTEAMQVLADNTTQDVSITKHGYAPKAPNISTQFLRGDATWAVPAGGAGGASLGLIVATGLGMNLS